MSWSRCTAAVFALFINFELLCSYCKVGSTPARRNARGIRGGYMYYCRIQGGYIKDTCGLHASAEVRGYMQDTCRIHAGYMQDTCKINQGNMRDKCICSGSRLRLSRLELIGGSGRTAGRYASAARVLIISPTAFEQAQGGTG